MGWRAVLRGWLALPAGEGQGAESAVASSSALEREVSRWRAVVCGGRVGGPPALDGSEPQDCPLSQRGCLRRSGALAVTVKDCILKVSFTL